MDRRVHRRLHHLTTKRRKRNPLRSEQDAFVLLVWIGAVAIAVALLGEFVAGAAAVAVLIIGLLAILRLYFEVGGPVRKRRKRKPGPGRSRRPRDGSKPS